VVIKFLGSFLKETFRSNKNSGGSKLKKLFARLSIVTLVLVLIFTFAGVSALAGQSGTGLGATGTITVDVPLTFNTDITGLTGSLASGFTLATNGVAGTASTHVISLSAPASTGLASSTGNGYAFTLTQNATQTTTLETYFSAKAGWTPAMETQIDSEITGSSPFFYLTYDGTNYALVDAFKLWLGSAYSPYPVTIDDDYPIGTYVYTGTLQGVTDSSPATLPITVTLQVIREYSYTVSPTTIAFTATPNPVMAGDSVALTGTTTVTDTGLISITSYTATKGATPVNLTVNNIVAVGSTTGTTSTPLVTGASETVTFTLNCTVGTIPGKIDLSKLTFTLTPN
jgi:hypothetical protein